MIFLSQTILDLNFSIWIPDCDSHDPTFLVSFIFCDPKICSTVVLHQLGSSDHILILVFVEFPSKSKGKAPFHCTTFNYSRAEWDDLHDHLRDLP